VSAWTGLQTDQPPVKTASGAPRTSFRFETPPRASRRPQVTDRRLDAEEQPPTEPPSCVTLSTLRDTGQGAAAVPHQQSLKQQLPSNNFTASRPYFKKKKKKKRKKRGGAQEITRGFPSLPDLRPESNFGPGGGLVLYRRLLSGSGVVFCQTIRWTYCDCLVRSGRGETLARGLFQTTPHPPSFPLLPDQYLDLTVSCCF